MLKLWMFENWQADQIDQIELTKNQAYLIGSFIDPERVKRILGSGGNTHISSDEELESSMDMVKKGSFSGSSENGEIKKKRKKKKLKLNG